MREYLSRKVLLFLIAHARFRASQVSKAALATEMKKWFTALETMLAQLVRSDPASRLPCARLWTEERIEEDTPQLLGAGHGDVLTVDKETNGTRSTAESASESLAPAVEIAVSRRALAL